jgi:16S rRNA G966 N2-methylase RsmD
VFRHVERRDPTSGLLDLVFLDPPYSLLREDKGRGRLAELLVSEALARNLAEEATVLLHVEREAGFVVPTGRLQVQDERIYGRSTLVFLGAESDRIPGQDPPPPSR